MRFFTSSSSSASQSRPHTPTDKASMGCCHSGRIDYEHDPVHLCHFDMHRVVGKGAFGKVMHGPSFVPSSSGVLTLCAQQVRVVQHKRSKAAYALKYINKQQCVKQKSVASIIQERHLLEEVCTRRRYSCVA